MRITVSGDAARTRLTKSATVDALCTVAVGLFGLQKKTRPAPFDASTSLSMSTLRLLSSAIARTGVPIFSAVVRGFSKVGQGVASGFDGEVKARTALVRISPDPAPSVT